MPANTDRNGPPQLSLPRALVVGAGPAGLIAAERLAESGLAVTVVEASPHPARKFLIAGRGGLNLTHAEPFDRFVTRYGAEAPLLAPHLRAFDPARLRAWADRLGADSFVGTSGRVFPRALKATPLLRAWLAELGRRGVVLRTRTRWLGPDGPGASLVETGEGTERIEHAVCILAMGGASWPRLGSDGAWTGQLAQAGIAVTPLRPANVGMLVDWSAVARARLAGVPLKNLVGWSGEARAAGELLLTAYGVEGQLVYALGRSLREQLAEQGEAILRLDLKPDLSLEQLTRRLDSPRGKASWSTFLGRRLRLPQAVPVLLREAGTGPEAGPAAIAAALKDLPIRLTGTRPIAEAISTAGGVAWAELDGRLMLERLPGTFVAGEMLDWEAPTGGYLLQATFATGMAAAEGAVSWLRERG